MVIKRQRTKERGAVALITAMIVSILLLITTSGMVALTLKSLRGSTDGAQSTKAYYAAEGGMEEALLKIRKGQPADNCPGASAADSAKDGVVTCVKVTNDPNQIEGQLEEGQGKQIDLSAVSGLKSLIIEWTTPEGATYDESKIPKYSDAMGSKFPQKGAAWPAAAPAVLEVGAIEYPGSATFSIGQVAFYQATLTPRSSKATDPSGSIAPSNGLNLYTYNDTDTLAKPFVTVCSQGATYQCKAGAYGLNTANRYILRLKSRYNGARYRITAQGANNQQLTIPGAVYTIDVTARAGDTFRRIQTSFPVGSETTATGLPGLDYVLYSDTDICKSFEIKGDVASGLNGCTSPF